MLNIKNISKTYNDANESILVFNDLSLSIDEGTIVSIMGKSGSGKSTLLNLIGGLMKPDAGQIFINNNTYNYNKYFSKFRLQTFGYIFQNHNLLPEFTVKENILLPTIIKSKENKIDEVVKYLDMFNMKKYADKYPTTMSKGECQRISIIRALINKPKLIIADEPTANLDENNIKLILDLFIKLNKEFNYTFIIATHDRKIAKITDFNYEIDNYKLKQL